MPEAPGAAAIVGLFSNSMSWLSVTEHVSRRFRGSEASRSLTFPLVLDDFEGQEGGEERRGEEECDRGGDLL